MSLRHVIVGAGAAGLAALGAIRRRDPAAPVTVVWDEPVRPYPRMALHSYVAGHLAEDDLFRHDEGLLDHPATQLLPGRKVQRLDIGAQQVMLDDGAVISYDRLLIATGAEPSRPPIPGLALAGALPMWTYRDARAIAARAASARRVVVLGAGFVGLQAAQALANGRRVTIVEAAGQVLPRMLDPEGAGIVRRLLARQGIAVIVGERAVEVAGSEAGESVLTLAGGGTLVADLIVVATGAQPRLELLAGTPFVAEGGIAVDAGQRTTLPGIYAAGDAARVAGLLGGERAAAGIWPAAVAQGEVAGANMAGGDERYRGDIPMNIVHVGGVTAAALGLVAAGGAEAESFGGADRYLYRRFLWQDDRLVGCVSIGPARDLGLLKELIGSGAPLANGRAALAAHLWDCSAPLLAARLLPRQ